MNYTLCPSCGQKALRVATRCPRCGLAFEEQFLSRARPIRESRRSPLLVLIVVAVVALVGANALMQRLATPPRGMSPPRARDIAVVPSPPRIPPPAPALGAPSATVESLRPSPPAPVVIDSAAAPRPVVRSATPIAASAGAIPSARRYASTWMNVRAERRNTAPVLRILHPGEAVEVDSLARGWYRVRSELQEVGYVDRRLLEDAPNRSTP